MRRIFPTKALFLLMAASAGITEAVAQTIPVSSTNSLFWFYTVGGPIPSPLTAIISARPLGGSGTGPVPDLTLTGCSIMNGPWASVSPAVGNGLATPVTFTFSVNPIGLAPGSYRAQFQVSWDGGDSSPLTLYLTVTAPAEAVTASPAGLSFSYAPGGPNPADQMLTISSNDGLGFTASWVVFTGGAVPWLTISPVSATATPAVIKVSVNASGLLPNGYNGMVTILTAKNTLVEVPVSLNVGGAGLTVTPASLSFNAPLNFGYAPEQFLKILALPGATVQAQPVSNGSWLSVDSPAIPSGTLGVRATDAGLAQGTYTGSITIQTSANYVTLPVALTVSAPASLSVAPAGLAFSYTIGGVPPSSQPVIVTSLTSAAQSFSAASATTDGAAWLTASASSPTPGFVSVAVNPGALVPGTYHGVVNVTSLTTGAAADPVAVTLTVNPAATPAVTSVVSAASYAGGAVSPGEFVVLFGSAIGPATLTTSAPGTAPATLGGTTVTFDGIAAPILYSSATQTSVQEPYGIDSPQTLVKVTRNGVTSTATALNSLPTFPGLFTSNSSGKGQAAALNKDFTLNGPSNPATRGDVMILYGTGEGKTNPLSVEGTITPGTQPLAQSLYPVTVTFGGVAGAVAYAGETPTALAGLMQINVVIPANAPVGAVPVLVTMNGQTSAGNVTVAIQ